MKRCIDALDLWLRRSSPSPQTKWRLLPFAVAAVADDAAAGGAGAAATDIESYWWVTQAHIMLLKIEWWWCCVLLLLLCCSVYIFKWSDRPCTTRTCTRARARGVTNYVSQNAVRMWRIRSTRPAVLIYMRNLWAVHVYIWVCFSCVKRIDKSLHDQLNYNVLLLVWFRGFCLAVQSQRGATNESTVLRVCRLHLWGGLFWQSILTQKKERDCTIVIDD